MGENTIDLYTKEGWETTVKSNMDRIARRAAEEELRLAEATLAITHDPLDGTKLSEPHLAVIVTIFGNRDEDKDDFSMVVRAFALAGNAFASMFTSEMWFSMVTWKPGEPPPQVKVRPSDDPNRREGLAMWTEHKTFGRRSHIAVIEKGSDGTRRIGPWDNGGNAGGRLADYLPAKKPTFEEQIICREFLRRRKLAEMLTLIKPEEFN